MKPSTSPTQTSSCPGPLVSVAGTAAHLSGSSHLASLCMSLSASPALLMQTTSQALPERTVVLAPLQLPACPHPPLGFRTLTKVKAEGALCRLVFCNTDQSQSCAFVTFSDLAGPMMEKRIWALLPSPGSVLGELHCPHLCCGEE